MSFMSKLLSYPHETVDFADLVLTENAATRESGFLVPVAFTPAALTALVTVDHDPNLGEVRLRELLSATHGAIVNGLGDGRFRRHVTVDYLAICRDGTGERVQVTCQASLVHGSAGGVAVLFRV